MVPRWVVRGHVAIATAFRAMRLCRGKYWGPASSRFSMMHFAFSARRAFYPEFEVRAELNSRHDAVTLTERLRDEGLLPVRRWRYLLVGATDEDSATELAAHIKTEIPSGGQVKVEGTVAAARAESGLNSFAVFNPHSDATPREGSIA